VLLYYITDRNQFPGANVERRAQLLDRIAQAAEAGVDWIQLREKDLAARALAQLAEEALRRIEPHRGHTRLLLNSRLDIALAVGAGGVHLAADDLAASQARMIATKAECVVLAQGVAGGQAHPEYSVRVAEEVALQAALGLMLTRGLELGALPGLVAEARATLAGGLGLTALLALAA